MVSKVISNRNVEEAIDRSRFRDKIRFLQENGPLCGEGFKRGNSYVEKPNCWGTTIFLLNAEKHILEQNKHERIGDFFVIGDKNKTSASFIPVDMERPGYVSGEHIAPFLKNYCERLPLKEPDCIMSIYQTSSIDSGAIHTMLYLGIVQDEPHIYEKKGLVGGFGPNKLRNRSSEGHCKSFRFPKSSVI